MTEEQEKLPQESETVRELQEVIKKLEQEKENYLEGWKRAKADLLSYKKEIEAKIQEFVKYANEDLVFDLISVLDSLDIAISNLDEKNRESPLGKGYLLLQSQLLGILKKYGLEIINPENEKFNPVFHEAVISENCTKENCDKSDDNIVREVLAKGYLLNSKLIRPAKVKVLIHQNG